MGKSRRSVEITDDNDVSMNVEETVALKKGITLLNSCGIIVGSIIGSGIFVSPAGVINNVQSVGASLLIWVLSGMFSLFGALCYAELGTMFHRSGGDYTYVKHAMGDFWGFLRMWVEVIVVRPVTQTIVAITFAKYALNPVFFGCEEPESALRLLAALCILTVTAANCFSVKLATLIQDFLSYAKLLALGVIIVTGFLQIMNGRTNNFANPFESTDYSLSSICSAFYSGLFAYNGWNYLNCVIEEMQNPKRDLPLAIVISCILVTVVYALANVAYFTIITPVEMLHLPAVAVTFATRLYGPFWWTVPVFVALSTFGGVNGILLTSSRIFLVAAEEGQVPSIFAAIQMNQLTPAPAVVFVGFVSMCYLLVTDVFVLMTYMGFVSVLAIFTCIAILIYYKWNSGKNFEGISKPSVRVPWLVPIGYSLFAGFMVTFAFFGSFYEALMGCAIILTGIPVYLLLVKWKKPRELQNRFDSTTRLLQRLFLVCRSRKEI